MTPQPATPTDPNGVFLYARDIPDGWEWFDARGSGWRMNYNSAWTYPDCTYEARPPAPKPVTIEIDGSDVAFWGDAVVSRAFGDSPYGRVAHLVAAAVEAGDR